MYTKQEISRQKQVFWTAFGKYMKPVLSADGEAISWLNYKTGKKSIHFRMDVDSRRAVVAVVMDDRSFFDQFKQLSRIFEETLEEDNWVWKQDDIDEHGRSISTILKQLSDVNIFRSEDWPAIISFLKPRIIALDAFWCMARYQFPS